MKGYDYKRYNLRFNVDYQATDWLTIKPKVWATRSDVMDQQQDLGAYEEASLQGIHEIRPDEQEVAA